MGTLHTWAKNKKKMQFSFVVSAIAAQALAQETDLPTRSISLSLSATQSMHGNMTMTSMNHGNMTHSATVTRTSATQTSTGGATTSAVTGAAVANAANWALAGLAGIALL